MNIKRLLGRLQVESEKIYIPPFNKKNVFGGYKEIIDNNDMRILEIPEYHRKLIVAAFNSVVVTHKKGKKEYIVIYPDYRNGLHRYKIPFNKKHFPDLIDNSKILNCMVIPFLRETEKDRLYKRWRAVVITDKCQIYHNFPKRDNAYEGFEEFGDIEKFEESVIWDIPGRKYPSDRSDCSGYEIYIPGLPKECYEYHPKVNQKSKCGNNGFDDHYIINDDEVIGRFYFPNRIASANPFFVMGGYEPDYKMTVVGTYRSNKEIGCRTCLFATSDGGRQWFAKYEFADEGVYDFKQGNDRWGYNFGNSINTKGILPDYTERCVVQSKFLNHDGSALFNYGPEVMVKKIRSNERVIIETELPHGFLTGNIVVLKKQSEELSEWDWIFNDSYSKKSSGNGKQFKIEIIDNKRFYLNECVSNPYTNIACRHIHHINRLRDGWLMGTGEIYPNGWLMYIHMKESDNYSRKDASSSFDITLLNSCSGSVQRTIGADLLDGTDCELIIASDHDLLERPDIEVSNEISISRNSTGIYIGKLKDIDSFSKFNIVYEAKEPAYFFKKLDNRYLFGGQRGEVAYCDSPHGIWKSFRIPSPLIHYRGSTYNFHVIDQYLIIFK